MLKDWLVRHMPGLGKYKRILVAWVDAAKPVRKSYSQYGEDVFISDTLSRYNLAGSVYVDVGANHPTDISNTYLLYRKGMHGIVVEPNAELIRLFKKFRKRDIPLMIGCSNKAAVLEFHISRTPVISSFSQDRPVDTLRTEYLPVMRLDDALAGFSFDCISLLSIDVEGLNFQVIEGAKSTIGRSLIICLEYDSPEEIDKFSHFLGSDFELLKTVHCNLIYLNKKLAASRAL